jgi:hypothetical protein
MKLPEKLRTNNTSKVRLYRYLSRTNMYKLEVTIARKVLPHPQGMAPAQFAE